MEEHDRVGSQLYRLFTLWQISPTLGTVPSSFGQTIKKKREGLGLTIEQVAERAGLTPNYLGTVENDRRDPSLSTIVSIAKGLRTPPGELLGPIKELSPEAYELARLFESLPPEVQDSFLRLFRSLTKKRR